MTTHDPSHSSENPSQKKADLRFTKHDFAAWCFDTLSCRVLYNNRYEAREDKLSMPLTQEFFGRMDAVTLGIPNFPPPAVVTWRSKDGVAHEATVDVGEIFKDQRILHNVREGDVMEDADVDSPGIILVVNDRTISVYMRAFVSLKEATIPGDKFSSARYDLVLAYSHTY